MKTKLLIISSCLLLVIAAFLLFKSSSYKNELSKTRQELNSAQDSVDYFKFKSLGDSLLLAEDYEGALENYQKAGRIFGQEELVNKKGEMAMAVKSRRAKMENLRNRVNQIQNDQLVKERSMGEEISLKDSLMRLSGTKLNMLLLETEELRDSLSQAYQEMERIAESVGEVEFKTPEGVQVFYAGDLENGQANGFGYGLFETGGIYSGEWKDNKRHGEGKYIWQDGNIYIGEYADNKRNGTGTYYFTSGEKYVGEWDNNKRSGQGSMYNKDGELILAGTWEDDEVVSVDKEG